MSTINVGISGILGKMGQRIFELIEDRNDMNLAAAIESPGSAYLQMDLGEALETEKKGIMITDGLQNSCDVLIDFSTPEGSRHRSQECVRQNTPLVVGTTGLEQIDEDRLRSAAETIPVLMASNMSIGMNLLFDVAPEIIRKLGDTFDIEIVEQHHRDKVDAPSGTALTLADQIAKETGANPEDDYQHGREGDVGPRPSDEIGLHAVRGGTENGTHRLILSGDDETIEITHRALSRDVFAQGALRAAEFTADAGPGFYTMQDVLG